MMSLAARFGWALPPVASSPVTPGRAPFIFDREALQYVLPPICPVYSVSLQVISVLTSPQPYYPLADRKREPYDDTHHRTKQ
jgi:hypothetical protein